MEMANSKVVLQIRLSIRQSPLYNSSSTALTEVEGQTAQFDYKVSELWNLKGGKDDYIVTNLTEEEAVLDAFRKVCEKKSDKGMEQPLMTPSPEARFDENSVGASKDTISHTGAGGSNKALKSTADSRPMKRLCVDLEEDDHVERSTTCVAQKLQVKQEGP